MTTGLEKVSFHSNPKERQCQRMLKLPHNCTHLTLVVMLKILQARLQQYVNRELPDVQAGFRKGRGTRDCQYPATNVFGTNRLFYVQSYTQVLRDLHIDFSGGR